MMCRPRAGDRDMMMREAQQVLKGPKPAVSEVQRKKLRSSGGGQVQVTLEGETHCFNSVSAHGLITCHNTCGVIIWDIPGRMKPGGEECEVHNKLFSETGCDSDSGFSDVLNIQFGVCKGIFDN